MFQANFDFGFVINVLKLVYSTVIFLSSKIFVAQCYVPCAAHWLNLLGQSAANNCHLAVWYFDFLQRLYSFNTSLESFD